MTAHQRALIKTAMVVGLIAILSAIATVWPPVISYTIVAIPAGILLLIIYMLFRMFEDDKDIRNKRL